MSPKDLCTLKILPKILKAGVYSLKIEGRMKKPEYVASVTAMYRKYVDMFVAKGEDGYKVSDDDIKLLMEIYNRGGFTEGYYEKHNGKELMSLDRPNHMGVKVANVLSVDVKRKVLVAKAIENISKDDVLEIFLSKGQSLYIKTDSINKNKEFTISFNNISSSKNERLDFNKLSSNINKSTSIMRTRNNSLIKNIQEKYIHTFANLTITGINSELSNKAFDIKRNGRIVDGKIHPGYKDSKYRLTKNVTTCSKWGVEELERRSSEIVDTFLRLYPFPTTSFKPLPKPVEEFFLEDESFSPTNRILKGFRLFNTEYIETTWKGMLLKVVSLIMDRYPDIVDSLYDKEGYFWTSKQADIQYCTMIAPNKFLWTTIDNKGKIRCLRYLFNKCDIAESELAFILEPNKEI